MVVTKFPKWLIFKNLVLGLVLFSLPILFSVALPQTVYAATRASDDFETGNYSGGTGWTGNWVEVGDDGAFDGGEVQNISDSGSRRLRVENTSRGAYRVVNLSAVSVAFLTFEYRRSGLDDANDYVLVQVSTNGGSEPWTEVGRIAGPGTDGSYTRQSINISSYRTANTAIRFYSSPNLGDGDIVYFDNVLVHDSVDLSITKTDSADPVVRGWAFTYTMTIANAANVANATGVTVTDNLPAGLTYLSAVPSQGTCSASGSTVTCSLGNLNAGASATITLTVVGTSAGTLTNTASVTSTEADFNAGNNSASQATTISNALTDTCYAVADDGDRMVTVTRSTGSGTQAGSGLGVLNVEAIAYWAPTLTLYAADSGTVGRINTSTGVFTTIGAAGTGNGALGAIAFTDLDALTFDPFTGYLYAAHRRAGAAENDVLLRINPATGAFVPNAFGAGIDYVVIPAVQSGLNDVDDIAISPLNGVMYAVQNDSGTIDRMISVNKTTGASTDIARFYTTGVNYVNDMEGLGYDGTGVFYGTTGNASTPTTNNNRFWRITPGTAQVTLINVLPNPPTGDYEGCDCLTDGANTIAGTVFNDADNDTTQDTGEAGTPNVTVNLYRDVNGNGQYDAGTDTWLASKDTDANGNYYFSFVANGNFVLTIDTGDLPAGHMLTSDNLEIAALSTFGNLEQSNNYSWRSPTAVTLSSFTAQETAGVKIGTIQNHWELGAALALLAGLGMYRFYRFSAQAIFNRKK